MATAEKIAAADYPVPTYGSLQKKQYDISIASPTANASALFQTPRRPRVSAVKGALGIRQGTTP